MNNDAEIEAVVKQALYDVAPDVAGEPIDPDISLRDQFEIDSMDFLNFIIGINKATQVNIPEADYDQLQSISGAVAYIRQHRT